MHLASHDLASRQLSLLRIEERNNVIPALITVDVGDLFAVPPIGSRPSFVVLYNESGEAQTLQVDDQNRCQAPIQYGYYKLALGVHHLTLAVAPKRCFGVGNRLRHGKSRAWGLGAQVYSLPHRQDGGLGDSRSVATLARAIGKAGGDALALSPLHAMSPGWRHYSPYSPSHRCFLNWMHADAAQIFGDTALRHAITQAGVESAWTHAHEGRLVDWSIAYALRRNVLRHMHAHALHADPSFRDDLEHFSVEGGDALHRHACIAARQSHAVLHAESTSWHRWRDDWQREPAAQRFADDHRGDIDFEVFLQWLSARCWEKTCDEAHEAGQQIGLIWDLAVGFEPGGSEAWAHRGCVLDGLELGAPPDAFNPAGQRWGITSYSPWGLRRSGFQPFIDLLRANMARGGGLRIDHIIGFRHLWVLPQGGPSTEGGYIQLPLDDLLRLTALESWRHRCIVIGEDLGTVPAGLRDKLAVRGVLGIDVLLFTRDENGDFLPPSQWRPNTIATTTTHDMPPLAGWRQGIDIEQLSRMHALRDGELERRMQERQADVARLDDAMAAPESGHYDAKSHIDFVARSRSPLVLIPVEDMLGRVEQPNVPGTVETYPNWQHRLPLDAVSRLEPVMQSLDRALNEAAPA
nr:4-alpha-glucanotransferase [Dyella sp. 2HG41-7]